MRVSLAEKDKRKSVFRNKKRRERERERLVGTGVGEVSDISEVFLDHAVDTNQEKRERERESTPERLSIEEHHTERVRIVIQ